MKRSKLFWPELDQEVDVAVRAGLAARHGAEEGEASDAELANLRFGREQALDRFVPGRRRCAHARTLSSRRHGAK